MKQSDRQGYFNFPMTTIEEDLFGPGGAEVKTKLLEQLKQKDHALRDLMKAGLPPDAYEVAERVRAGVAAAHEVVCRFQATGAQSSENFN